MWCALAALAMAAEVSAQPSVRQRIRAVEREIRLAQARTDDFYKNAHPNTFAMPRLSRDRSTGRIATADGRWPPPPNCVEYEDISCLWGDRECLECQWDAKAMRELVEHYERTAARIGRPPAGVRVELLDWFVGQRAGVWTRLREFERARAVAGDDCYAAAWWCESLRGLIEHRAGDHVSAEQHFERALRLMSPGRACFWNELHLYSDTLAGTEGATPSIGFDPNGRFRPEPRQDRGRPCPDRAAVDRFWVLADPLFTQPGNDRRTEHYARHAELHIHALFRIPMGMFPDSEGVAHYSWHQSPVLRWGWPVGRSRENVPIRRAMVSSSATAPVYDPRGQSFIITTTVSEALRAPSGLFAMKAGRAQERHRSPYGKIEALPLQTGFFRRRAERVLLVRAAAPTTSGSVPWAMRSWDGDAWHEGTVERDRDALIAWVPTPWIAQIVSVEAVHGSGAWRARTGTRPPESVANAAVSSLILIAPGRLPNSLEEAADVMLPRTTVSAGESVAGFFEFYSPETRTAAIELAIKPIAGGFMERIGIGRQPDRTVRWSEALVPASGVVSRTVVIDLGALPPADYDVVLTLVLDSGEVLRSFARVVIE